MIYGKEDLELRDVLKKLTIQEARHQLISASHRFNQRFRKALVFLHFNGRHKPGSFEPGHIVIDALIFLHHESVR